MIRTVSEDRETDTDSDLVFLPEFLFEKTGETADIRFGGVTVRAAVRRSPASSCGDGTFGNPASLRFSPSLCRRLALPAFCTWRIVAREHELCVGPVVGLLLGLHTERYTPAHMRKYSDRLDIYPSLGGLFCAFSPLSVNWKRRTAKGLLYNPQKKKWEYGSFPLPNAIYRRDFHTGSSFIKKLEEATGGRLFNSYRFSKYELYDALKLDRSLSRAVPPTALCEDPGQVRRFIEEQGKAILKPFDLSRGRGICVAERDGGGYLLTDYREREKKPLRFADASSLEGFFDNNPEFFNRYLIQRYLPLCRIGASLFDIRVVMQKAPDRAWRCTGIECRVSEPGSHLTNISRGGRALTLDQALCGAFGENDAARRSLPPRIDALCREFCLYMDTTGEHFAEFGIDVAVDTEKNVWLIEANVFPSFKGFKRTAPATYLAIRHQPLLYALSLTEFYDEEDPG